MSTTAEESLSNIKTVKSFAEEVGHIDKFDKASWEVFEAGRTKAYFWAVFFFSTTFLGHASTVLLILGLSKFWYEIDVSIGTATSVLLYQRTIV